MARVTFPLRFAGVLAVVRWSALAPMVTSAASTPALAWSPSGAFDYGVLDAAAGQRASHTFTLSNVEGKSGRISIVLTGSPTFTRTMDDCSGKRLNKPCSVTVTYAPSTNGAMSASLTATSTSGATATISLTGASAWRLGDFRTYTQLHLDASTAGAPLLMNNYFAVYASNAGLFVIGRVSSSSFSAIWTSASALLAFLPAGGPPGPLTGDLANPTSSSAGVFAGDAVALKLNVDFSDAGVLLGNSPRTFGDVTVCELTSARSSMARPCVRSSTASTPPSAVRRQPTASRTWTTSQLNSTRPSSMAPQELGPSNIWSLACVRNDHTEFASATHPGGRITADPDRLSRPLRYEERA